MPQDVTAEWRTIRQYFDVSCVPSNFFTGPNIDEFIASLQAKIDILSTDSIYMYTKCIVSLEEEMRTKLSHSNRSCGGCSSKHRRYKPFWSDTLTELWNSYTDKLNLWKTSKATDKSELRNQWIIDRKVFDKALLAAKRNYWLSMQQELIQLQTRNPQDFWQYVKRIGSKNSELPREVRLTDGSISSEPQEVLDRWADAFEKLLEVLRNGNMIDFMCLFFNKCFSEGTIPSEWSKGIIHPIPKDKSMDPLVPMDYKGITLTCIMYKRYCTVLNHRLTQWVEQTDILT